MDPHPHHTKHLHTYTEVHELLCAAVAGDEAPHSIDTLLEQFSTRAAQEAAAAAAAQLERVADDMLMQGDDDGGDGGRHEVRGLVWDVMCVSIHVCMCASVSQTLS